MFKSPSHDAVPAFAHFDEVVGAAGISQIDALQELQLCALSRPVIQGDALANGLFFFRLQTLGEQHLIGTRDLIARVRKAMHELPVVGKEQESFRTIVEAADGIEQEFYVAERREIENSDLAFFSLTAGQSEVWLVEHPVNTGWLAILNQLTLDHDLIGIRLDLRPRFAYHFAVDADLALEKHLLRFSPRGYPELGEPLLYSHVRH